MLLAVGIHLLGGLTEGLLSEVALVSEEDDGDGSVVSAPRDLRVDVRLPLRDRVERVDPRKVEHHKRTHRLLVVDTRHVAETLLPGNVPELKPHLRLGVPLDELERKVNADLMQTHTQKN